MNSKKATIYDYARMCKKYDNCKICPLGSNNNKKGISCDYTARTYPDEANEIILKWCDEHPVETRQDKFLKMFPNAQVTNDGVLCISPCDIDKNRYIDAAKCSCPKAYGFNNCIECRKEYWLAEVDDGE